MVKILEIADLHFLGIGNGSDKVYHAALTEAEGGYLVEFAYGRRFSALTRGFKTPSPLPLDKARKVEAYFSGSLIAC